MSTIFQHAPNPHLERHRHTRPPKVAAEHGAGFNGRLALILTRAVGTMWCAYAFALLALVALPSAISGGIFATVQWISQTFIQLVMLSVIMVGQNILGAASDKRAEMTYNDAEATFHEASEIQRHLSAQDGALSTVLTRIEGIERGLTRS